MSLGGVMARSAPLLFPRARSARKFDLDDGRLARLRELWPVFKSNGERTGISPYILAGVSWGESDYIRNAKGPAVPWRGRQVHGLGLMQVMEFHDASLGGGVQGLLSRWTEPAFNVRIGADILRDQVRAHGSLEKGLLGYGGFKTKDGGWYVDEALGRAFVLQLMNEAGTLNLDG